MQYSSAATALPKVFFLLWTHLRCNSSLVNAFDLWLRSLQFSQLSSPEVWTSNQPLRHSMFTRLGGLASPLWMANVNKFHKTLISHLNLLWAYILMNDSSSIWDDTFKKMKIPCIKSMMHTYVMLLEYVLDGIIWYTYYQYIPWSSTYNLRLFIKVEWLPEMSNNVNFYIGFWAFMTLLSMKTYVISWMTCSYTIFFSKKIF